MKIILAFILGFGLGVWLQYLNVLFWRNYTKRKYSQILKSKSVHKANKEEENAE